MTEETFAERLKRIRKENRYTQRELASISNISLQTIRNYEQGVSEPISRYLIELSLILEVSPEYLLFGNDDTNACQIEMKSERFKLNNSYEMLWKNGFLRENYSRIS